MAYNARNHYTNPVMSRALSNAGRAIGGGIMSARVRMAMEEERAKEEEEEIKNAETLTKAYQTIMETNPEAYGGSSNVQNYISQSRNMPARQAAVFLGAMSGKHAVEAFETAKAERAGNAYASQMRTLGQYAQGAGMGVLSPAAQAANDRLLQNPTVAAEAQAYASQPNPMAAERLAGALTANRGFEPGFMSGEAIGGPPGSSVFRGSANTAQYIPPPKPPSTGADPARELMLEIQRGGTDLKSGQEALQKYLSATRTPDGQVMPGAQLDQTMELRLKRINQLHQQAYGTPFIAPQASAVPGVPAPGTPAPMTTEEFLSGF